MVPANFASLVAKLIYNSDCNVRNLMVRGITTHNERSYMGALAHDAASGLLPLISGSTFTLSIGARDTHSYDGIFVFRFGNQIKIGVCESKILRLSTPGGQIIPNLNSNWDGPQAGSANSHFTQQIFNYQNWQPVCAVWCMFMLDLGLNQLPPLESLGSDCIWLDDVLAYYQNHINNNSHLWTYNDIINNPSHINLEEVVRAILVCEKGRPIYINAAANQVSIEVGESVKNIPIPSLEMEAANFTSSVHGFLEENNLSFYRFIDFPELEFDYKGILRFVE